MAKPGPKRNNAEIARDRRLIAHLYLNVKLSQAEIADELNRREDVGYTLTQQMVSYDLGVLEDEWMQSGLMDLNEAKARELARIDRLEVEYWEAWLRSCEDAETITERGKGARDEPKPVSFEKTIQRKGQAGDPRFLAGIQWCIEQRCKILGLHAPQRSDITSGGKEMASVVVYVPDNGRNPEQ